MQTIQFKTNIMCSSCVAKVTPALNETVGELNWEVNTKDPKKILTITADTLNGTDVINALEKSGFKAEKL